MPISSDAVATFIVAAFSDAPFRGNPAGVCILPAPIDARRMQAVAAELRQPETAFVVRHGDHYAIRWFSPLTEVDLCGHATLAAAHVLWTEAGMEETTLRFVTANGTSLDARCDEVGTIWLDLPAVPGAVEAVPDALAACAGTDWIAASRHDDRWILECRDAESVRAARPDFARLAETAIRSLILTAVSNTPHHDIISRNFAPIVGVNEDQVTGTAHACLAPYWRDRLGTELRCWQASQRGGSLRTRLKDGRVELGGRAVIEFEGLWKAL